MHIKQQGFKLILPKILPNLIFLNGNDTYLLIHFKQLIQEAWLKHSPHTIITQYSQEIIKNHDWSQVQLITDNHSLFKEQTLINISYSHKIINDDAQEFIYNYLQHPDQSVLIILHAPHITPQSVKFITSLEDQAALLTFKAPAQNLTEQWITQQLHKYQFASIIPKLIYHYTQGNLLACAQTLEKLTYLSNNTIITTELLKQHLNNQAIYQLYTLSDACLLGNQASAIMILHNIIANNYDWTLILWIISQELRNLLQLYDLQTQNNCNFNEACIQLKLWPSKFNLYQQACKRIKYSMVLTLLSWCNKVDQNIKKHHINSLTRRFEILIFSFCCGFEINYFE